MYVCLDKPFFLCCKGNLKKKITQCVNADCFKLKIVEYTSMSKRKYSKPNWMAGKNNPTRVLHVDRGIMLLGQKSVLRSLGCAS